MDQNQESSSNELECIICGEMTDKAEIMCEGNHVYCFECFNQMYETYLINNNEITNLCTLCKNPYFENKMEAILREDILLELTKKDIFSRFALPPNLSLMHCPLCPQNKSAVFLIDENDYIQFYSCEKCENNVCLFCLEKCENKANHKNCSKLQKICCDLDKLVDFGLNLKCSECKKLKKSSGYSPPNFKDTNCSHVKCKKCNSQSCYICSGHVDMLDKSNLPKDLIFRHNDDWKTNDKRCPLYIQYFNQLYSDWPSDPTEANAKFFEYKLRVYLEKIKNKFGKENVKKAYQHFKEKRLNNLSADIFEYDYVDFKHFPIIDLKIMQFFKV